MSQNEAHQGLLSQEWNEEKFTGGRFSIIGNKLRGVSIKNVLMAILAFLAPEVFQRRGMGNTKRPGPTAWLDGLRGVAALSVATMHMSVYTHTNLELCYGAGVGWQRWNTSLAAWPIFRLPFTGGHFAVILFFTISGYVVPRRLISLLNEGRKDDFVEAINAAMVRRPGRLYIPVLFMSLVLPTFLHITGIPVVFPTIQSNMFLELWAWWKDQMKFLYYYRGGFLFTYYNPHTWTIPVELRGSMNIFVFLFAVHQCSTRWRVLLCLGMTLYLAVGASGAWYAAFFAGMFTSELDLIATNGLQVSLPWDGLVAWFAKRKRAKLIVMHIILYIGLYLASQPSSDTEERSAVYDECGAWKYLNKVIPDSYKEGNTTYRWFWLFWGAWLILFSVGQISWVKWIFETGPAQCECTNTTVHGMELTIADLGRHSFALYLVHGPIIAIFSDRLFYLTGMKLASNEMDIEKFGHLQNKWKDASWWPLPEGGPYALEPNFLFCVACSLVVMLYVAELGTKMFDVPGVKISRWMWAKLKAL